MDLKKFHMSMWIVIALFVIGSVIALVIAARSKKYVVNRYDRPTTEEVVAHSTLGSVSETASSRFPNSLYLLPIFFGIIGGIIGALIAAKAYKTKWWPMLIVGIASSAVSWLIYVLVIPMN